MATDSILGLFTSPQQYQQALQTEALGQGMKMAQLSPLEAGRAMGYAGAAQVGRGLVGALGGEDPALQLQSLRLQIMKDVDPNNPADVARAASALAQAGDQQGAFQLSQTALARRDVESQIQGRTEEKQAQREMQMQMARERIQANIDIARERGATQLQIAQMMQEGRMQLAQLAAAMKTSQPKMLPASLQKDESKDLETIDTYTAQQQALQPAISSLTPNERGVRKLELGPVKNLQYAAQNLAGNSTPESRAYEGLKSAVDTAVNLQVSAEKGVQTDKDVLRFAQALIAAYGRNDSEATLQALKRYNDSLAKAQDRTKSRLESRRKSQGVEPYFTGQEQRPQGTMENPIVLK
jgi:hypothetical protein